MRKLGTEWVKTFAASLVVLGLLVLLTLGATSSWGPIVSSEPLDLPTFREPSVSPESPLEDLSGPPEFELPPERDPVVPSWIWELLRAALVGVAVVAVVTFLLRVLKAVNKPGLRTAKAASGEAVEISEIAEEEMVQTLEQSMADLRSGMNVDDAVVQCWRRMEQVAAETGVQRLPHQTAEEFTVAILSHTAVDVASLQDLAGLYRQAMFSTHELSDQDRDRAISSMERLVTQLRGPAGDAS